MPAREQYAGVKVGGVNVSIGRMANAYNGGVKIDTMTANFLEARNMAGGVAKVPSFVSGLLGVSGSAIRVIRSRNQPSGNLDKV